MNDRAGLISRMEKVLGGTPVITGTRVPVHALLDYLAADDFAGFLDDFPTVQREQAEALRHMARHGMNLLEDPDGRVCSEPPEA